MFLIQNIQNDGLLMSWLTRTMTEEVLTLLVRLETACQIWLALEESFAAANKYGKVQLRQHNYNNIAKAIAQLKTTYVKSF